MRDVPSPPSEEIAEQIPERGVKKMEELPLVRYASCFSTHGLKSTIY